GDRRLIDTLRVTNTRQHVGNRITHTHYYNPPLPASFGDARYFATHHQLAQLATRDTKFTENTTWTTGQRAAITQTHRAGITWQTLQLLTRFATIFQRRIGVADNCLKRSALGCIFFYCVATLLFALNQTGFRHGLIPKREAESSQQSTSFIICLCCRCDGDVHATQRIDLVVLDFRENDLFLDAHVVVATTIKGFSGNAAEVTNTRNRDRHQTIEEFVHAFATQRNLATDRITITDFEGRHRLLGLGHDGLLTGDLFQVGNRIFHDLLVR